MTADNIFYERAQRVKRIEREDNAKLRALVKELAGALDIVVGGYERQCETWDQWCGAIDCPKCGPDAAKIAAGRAVLAKAREIAP